MEAAGTQTPPPRPRRRRLGSLANVKAGLGDVIRRLESGELEVKRGNALVYAYSALANIMQGEKLAEIQAQLDELRAEGLLK